MKFRVRVLADLDDKEGSVEVWDLPWERLVYDQRVHHRSGDADAVLYKVRKIEQTPEGDRFVMVPDPGPLPGADPKKFLAAPTE